MSLEARDSLLTTTDVAAQLRVSVRTVCFRAECSELPAVKAGRRCLFAPKTSRRGYRAAVQLHSFL